MVPWVALQPQPSPNKILPFPTPLPTPPPEVWLLRAVTETTRATAAELATSEHDRVCTSTEALSVTHESLAAMGHVAGSVPRQRAESSMTSLKAIQMRSRLPVFASRQRQPYCHNRKIALRLLRISRSTFGLPKHSVL